VRFLLPRMTPLGGAIAATLLMSLIAVPALAQPAPQRPTASGDAVNPLLGPTLDVANPNPGDLLTPGRMFMSGVAFDDQAENGVGVDRVSVFLGDRENGGLFLGDARLGMHNPQAVEGGDVQFENAGWRILTPTLKATGQALEMHVYARSAVTGRETIVVIPIVMGEAPEADGGGAGGGGGGGEAGGGEE
jgi:hypothetical protein